MNVSRWGQHTGRPYRWTVLFCLALFIHPFQVSARCTVLFTAEGIGSAAGLSAQTRQITAKKQGKRNAYRALMGQVYGFALNGDSTVSSVAKRNYNFRRQIQRKIRAAKVVAAGYESDQQYKVVLELLMTLPSAADRSQCQESTAAQRSAQQSQSAARESDETGDENFLTRLTHRLTGPILDPKQNPDADSERYTTVPPEDRLLDQEKPETASHPVEIIRDGVDMVLVNAVKKDQKNAPALFRQAVLDGMDREVALTSVLMGMIKPSPEELANLINQAVAMGITRGEVDRSVNRVKQACEVCKEIENTSAAPIQEIESGPVQQ